MRCLPLSRAETALPPLLDAVIVVVLDTANCTRLSLGSLMVVDTAAVVNFFDGVGASCTCRGPEPGTCVTEPDKFAANRARAMQQFCLAYKTLAAPLPFPFSSSSHYGAFTLSSVPVYPRRPDHLRAPRLIQKIADFSLTKPDYFLYLESLDSFCSHSHSKQATLAVPSKARVLVPFPYTHIVSSGHRWGFPVKFAP